MKRTFIIIYIMFIISINNSAFAQYGVVFDKKTTEQVIKNSAAFLATENITNEVVNENLKNQDKIQKNILLIQAALELYRYSYENVSHFDNESRNIKNIILIIKDIVEETSLTLNELKKNPKSTIVTQGHIIRLATETAQCAKTCYSLVTKSSVKALAGNGQNHDDGINWLNPKDRLMLSEYILSKLEKILFTLNIVKHQAIFVNEWSMVIYEVAPYDWIRVLRQKELADEIINSFSN